MHISMLVDAGGSVSITYTCGVLQRAVQFTTHIFRNYGLRLVSNQHHDAGKRYKWTCGERPKEALTRCCAFS